MPKSLPRIHSGYAITPDEGGCDCSLMNIPTHPLFCCIPSGCYALLEILFYSPEKSGLIPFGNGQEKTQLLHCPDLFNPGGIVSYTTKEGVTVAKTMPPNPFLLHPRINSGMPGVFSLCVATVTLKCDSIRSGWKQNGNMVPTMLLSPSRIYSEHAM